MIYFTVLKGAVAKQKLLRPFAVVEIRLSAAPGFSLVRAAQMQKQRQVCRRVKGVVPVWICVQLRGTFFEQLPACSVFLGFVVI